MGDLDLRRLRYFLKLADELNYGRAAELLHIAQPALRPTIEEKLELVTAGRGIVILPASVTRYYSRPDVTYARVTDLPDTEVCLVVESRRRSDVLRELVRSAQAIPSAGFTGSADASPASVGTR
jgi:DNA-binding transcriptional LysR family regulator